MGFSCPNCGHGLELVLRAVSLEASKPTIAVQAEVHAALPTHRPAVPPAPTNPSPPPANKRTCGCAAKGRHRESCPTKSGQPPAAVPSAPAAPVATPADTSPQPTSSASLSAASEGMRNVSVEPVDTTPKPKEESFSCRFGCGKSSRFQGIITRHESSCRLAPPSDPDHPKLQEAAGHLTGTQRAVVLCLRGGDFTQREIVEKTGCPRRTVYQACKDLEEMGLVKSRPSLKDTRQDIFYLSSDANRLLKDHGIHLPAAVA